MKRIAIIGCGKIFLKHYEAIRIQEKKRRLKLVAVCDKNKELLNNIKDKKIKKYIDLNELIENEKLDLISILTPSGFHYENAIKCCGKVKTIIIEKPITLKLSHAKNLISLSKKKSKIFVVLQNRFNDPIIELKKAIDQNLFGNFF